MNFGWALTQNPKVIPIDGSTITVLVDGVAVGNVDYNHFRPDIASMFPGLANSNGAVGFRILDTTTLTNGLHTVSWTVGDSGNNVEGIGSRYFTVDQRCGRHCTAAAIPADEPGDGGAMTGARAPLRRSAPRDAQPVIGTSRLGSRMRRGVGTPPAAARRAVVRGEEVDRFELQLGEHPVETYTGYLQSGDDLLAPCRWARG